MNGRIEKYKNSWILKKFSDFEEWMDGWINGKMDKGRDG